jgi:hypothetical protein
VNGVSNAPRGSLKPVDPVGSSTVLSVKGFFVGAGRKRWRLVGPAGSSQICFPRSPGGVHTEREISRTILGERTGESPFNH